jgi:hypothetical protein
MDRFKRILALAAALPLAVSSFAFTASAEGESIYYDGTENVRGFSYPNYDDATMRNGGYDAGYDPTYDYTKDEQEVKYFIDENFSFPGYQTQQGEAVITSSSWDVRNIGGSNSEQYFFYYGLNDTSDKYPVEVNRKFENANHGKLTFEFLFTPIDAGQDGVTFRLYGDNTAAIGFVMRNDKLYLEQRGGNEKFVGDVKVRGNGKIPSQGWASETLFDTGVRVQLNMDTNTMEKVFVNGTLVAENEPFLNDVAYINNCNINTGDKNTGTTWMRAVKLYRGYLLHDQFLTSMNNVPGDYNPSGDVSMEGMFKSQPFDWFNMVLGRGASVNKAFEQVNDKAMVFEYHFMMPEKTDGFELKLVGKGKDTIRFTTENGNFCYDTGNGSQLLYENYYKNVWYKIRAYLDLENKTVDLYLNGMKKFENVPLSNSSLDRMWVSVSQNAASSVKFDFPRLWFDTPEPEDYCPMPQPVKPTDSSFEVGMQVCPMWRSGYHAGWDNANRDKNRLPYYGYYDEGSPEVADWIIKDLVEHGFTYQRITIGAETPISPCDQPFGFWYLDEGYKYAKYSDMMKYCVLWENASKYDTRPEYIIDTFAPYCIEHYFKDDRYLRIDDRPVFVVYNLNSWKAHAAAQDDESIKALSDGFRQKCIEAGVGNPIMAIGAGLNESGLELAKKYGFDVSTSYFASFTTDGIKEQLDMSLKNADKGTGIVTLGGGINGINGSYNFTPQDFGNVIDYYKETREKYPADSLARKTVCFDTFDEFAEGHYLAPCGLYGFGYYDQVRQKFCGGDPSDHTDTVPTTSQKDRFNNCYPPNRRLVNKEQRNGIGSTVPEDAKVVYKWDFENPDEFVNWSSLDVSGLHVEGGCLVGSVSGPDSQIYTPNINIDSNGIVQVKMRIKYDTKAQCGNRTIFYVCDNGYSWREAQAATNSKLLNAEEGFVDVIFPIAGTNLTGKLKQLRLDPINYNPSDYTDTKFMIDSIEIIYSPAYDTTEADNDKFNNAPAYTKIGDEIETIGSAPAEQDGKWYYPLRSVSYNLGAKVDYDGKNNKVNVIANGSIGEIDLSEQKAYVNGGTVRENPVVINKNDTTYISGKFFTQMFGKKLEYDESTRIITVSDAVTGAEKHREIIESFEFEKDGDLEGWGVMQSVGAFESKGGKATGKITKTEPILVKSGVEIKAAAVKNIAVSFMNNTDSSVVKMYFLTDSDKQWSESKVLSAKQVSQSEDYKVYNIDPSSSSGWGGTITDVRFDPGNGSSKGNFGIDYIRFEGEYVSAAANVPCVTITDNEYKWDFNVNSTVDGWMFSRQLGDCVIENGLLSAYVIGPAPKLYSIGDLNLNASDIEEIEIKLNNATDGTAAKWQFLMNGEKDYEKAVSVDFEIKPNDTEGSIYNIKTSDIEGFEGVLNGICLSPTNGTGAISIDYICLVTTEK